MSQHSISSTLLNVVLVVAESVITVVLRFDANLRKAVYPLAKNNAVVCIRSYLPHTQFYATFSTKGILLDIDMPAHVSEPNVVVNAYTHQLLNALVSNDATQISKLTMRGDTETVNQVRHFLVQLGVVSLFQSLVKTFKGDNSKEDKPAKEPKQPDYEAKIEEQQQQLTKLSIRNRELEVSLKEAHSKQKVTFVGFIVASLLAIIAIIGWLTQVIT